jgi:hypothetical protein
MLKKITLAILACSLLNNAIAQSPDSRICNCFATPVSENFMDATRVIYGSIGVVVKRNEEIKPAQSQPVRFIIPRLTPKPNCSAVYNIYITDESGAVVYSSEDSHNEFSWTFDQCDKRYEVRLLAVAKSGTGGDGNCSRGITFYIKPNCNNATCNCDPVNRSGKPMNTSINFNLEGKVTCTAPTATRRTYILQYAFTNKTNCKLLIQSVTVLGETIGSASSPTTIIAHGHSATYNTGFSTALSRPSPTESSVNLTVRYKLNNKECTASIKVPYERCR